MVSLDIVIPCLNEEKYISRSLCAIDKEFAHVPFVKVIVVDNGSTDKTAEVVLDTKRKIKLDVKLIESMKRGVSRARNCGISAGSGSFVLFLDADNIVKSGFAKELIHKIEQENFGFAHIAVQCLDRGLPGYLIFQILDIIKQYVDRPFGKFVVSRELLNKSGLYNERIDCGENVEIGCRLYKAAKANRVSYQRIGTPISTGIRRFKQHGYVKTLLVWLVAYLGYYKQKYPKVNDDQDTKTSHNAG